LFHKITALTGATPPSVKIKNQENTRKHPDEREKACDQNMILLINYEINVRPIQAGSFCRHFM
jgi:hypothetical protein